MKDDNEKLFKAISEIIKRFNLENVTEEEATKILLELIRNSIYF